MGKPKLNDKDLFVRIVLVLKALSTQRKVKQEDFYYLQHRFYKT